MSDEQRVRSALDYDLEPWQPDAGDLMRRGKRLAWLRRGLAAAGVTALAGTVATVSAAVGGPADVKNLLAGGGKPPVPVVIPRRPRSCRRSTRPACRPSRAAEGDGLDRQDHRPEQRADDQADPAGQADAARPGADHPPSLPGKPSLPTTKPSLPSSRRKPTLPDRQADLCRRRSRRCRRPSRRCRAKPTLPTAKPTLPGKPTLPPVPTTKPTLPSKPPVPTAKPSLPTTVPSVPASRSRRRRCRTACTAYRREAVRAAPKPTPAGQAVAADHQAVRCRSRPFRR